MRINSEKLEEVILVVAQETFAHGSFGRRQLMDATEQRLRELGH